MTREEAIEYNKNLREYMRITDKESEYKFLKENYEALDLAIKALEQEPRCKECKWWKDSDGKYRRGIGAESHCPINSHAVYCGDGYCYMFSPKADMRGEG